jgi:hypothetical protein
MKEQGQNERAEYIGKRENTHRVHGLCVNQPFFVFQCHFAGVARPVE